MASMVHLPARSAGWAKRVISIAIGRNDEHNVRTYPPALILRVFPRFVLSLLLFARLQGLEACLDPVHHATNVHGVHAGASAVARHCGGAAVCGDAALDHAEDVVAGGGVAGVICACGGSSGGSVEVRDAEWLIL